MALYSATFCVQVPGDQDARGGETRSYECNSDLHGLPTPPAAFRGEVRLSPLRLSHITPEPHPRIPALLPDSTCDPGASRTPAAPELALRLRQE